MSLSYVRRTSIVYFAALVLVWFACGPAATMDVTGWDPFFAFHYDYTLEETAGLQRENEPVEVTLSVPADAPRPWREYVRVVRLEGEGRGVVVPHQLMGEVAAVTPKSAAGRQEAASVTGDAPTAASVESVNIVFLASCPKRGNVTYRLFWGLPVSAAGRQEAASVVTKRLRRTCPAPSNQTGCAYAV